MANSKNAGAKDLAAQGDYWVDLARGESPLRVWDQLVLGNFVFPGLAAVEPAVDIAYDVVKQNTNINSVTAPPKYKITLTDKGYNPAQIRATVQVWDPGDWKVLKKVLPQFAPKKTSSTRDAYDIVHPSTRLLGIDSVVIIGVSIPQVVNQTLIVQMAMLQYFPQTKIKLLHSSGGPLIGFDVPAVNPGANIK